MAVTRATRYANRIALYTPSRIVIGSRQKSPFRLATLPPIPSPPIHPPVSPLRSSLPESILLAYPYDYDTYFYLSLNHLKEREIDAKEIPLIPLLREISPYDDPSILDESM